MSSAKYFADLLEGRAEMPPDLAEAVRILAKLYRETGDSYDWVPVSAAYAAYLGAEPTHSLTINKIGLALSLAFPNSAKCQRRTESGARANGRIELTGPGGLRTPDEYETYKRRADWRQKHGDPD